jgi:predicted RNase H-like nuclease (RuvC/YqgF family)
MNDPRRTGDDADIDLDTQELVPPASQEPLGYGPGEWASAESSETARAESAASGTEQRLRNAEAAIDTLRTTTSGLEREIALMRADLERLRQESEKAAGSRLP